MRKLLMSLLMAGSLLAGGIGAALADDASAPAAASAPDATASAPAPDASAAPAAAAASAPAADASAAPAASAAAAPAASDAAPAAPTAPFSVDSSKINSGDTAWMLTSTALVLFMTIPGLALFYAVLQCRAHALAAFAHFQIRQPDNRKRG